MLCPLVGLLLGIQSVMAGRLTVGQLIYLHGGRSSDFSPMTCIQLYNNMSATQPLLDKIMQPVQAEKSHPVSGVVKKQTLIKKAGCTVGYPNRPLIKALNSKAATWEKVLPVGSIRSASQPYRDSDEAKLNC